MSSNFSFQDLLVISAVASLVTIVTILCWGFCARNIGRCRRVVAPSTTLAHATSTPVRNIDNSLELATLTPISIAGPLVQSPILPLPAQAQDRRKSGRKTKKPDYFTSCPNISDVQWLFLFNFVILHIWFWLIRPHKLVVHMSFHFIFPICPFGKTLSCL